MSEQQFRDEQEQRMLLRLDPQSNTKIPIPDEIVAIRIEGFVADNPNLRLHYFAGGRSEKEQIMFVHVYHPKLIGRTAGNNLVATLVFDRNNRTMQVIRHCPVYFDAVKVTVVYAPNPNSPGNYAELADGVFKVFTLTGYNELLDMYPTKVVDNEHPPHIDELPGLLLVTKDTSMLWEGNWRLR